MAALEDRPAVRREGKALIIKLPQRGKQKQIFPAGLVENLLSALKDLTLEVGEGVAVPREDDPEKPRVFAKQHQAAGFGRRLKDELAARDPKLGEVMVSTPSLGHGADGKATGPFALALKRKEEK